MNIYLYNCSNTFNYGSMMMGENFITYLNKITGEENCYFVETKDKINVERLIYATQYNNIFPMKMNSIFKDNIKNYEFILGYFKSDSIVSDVINRIDLVVVLGGDDFTEDYGWKGPVLQAIKFNILKKNRLKVVMLGQTMGPYHNKREILMKRLLSKVDRIYPRDPITYKYLKKIGLKNITIMDDLALAPLFKQQKQENTKEYITYCPSELIYRYSQDGKREDWINFNLFMIETVLKKFPDKKMVLLAHVLKPEHVNDSIITKELYDILKTKYPDRLIPVTEEIYPYEVRNYLQKSYLTISSRMHPVISSIQCEIPAIALSYSEKYWGIIGERYELGEYIIDIRQLSYAEMEMKFLELINRIDYEYSNIQIKMSKKNKEAMETIVSMIKDIEKL